MLPALITVALLSASVSPVVGAKRLPFHACVCLISNTHSDGDQRIATVHPVSQEVTLSASLRL